MNLAIMREMADDWPAAATVRTFTVTNPAAGADWSAVVPGESVWGVFSIAATLTTSAAVANRVPTLRVTDGSATLWRIGARVSLTAGLATLVSWLPGLGYDQTAIAGNSVAIGVPPLYVGAGQSIAVTTTAIDAGDQWSAINVNVVEVYHGHVEAEREIATRWVDKLEAIYAYVRGQVS